MLLCKAQYFIDHPALEGFLRQPKLHSANTFSGMRFKPDGPGFALQHCLAAGSSLFRVHGKRTL
jgi:hypothetical protein